jgi:hypothetical protein
VLRGCEELVGVRCAPEEFVGNLAMFHQFWNRLQMANPSPKNARLAQFCELNRSSCESIAPRSPKTILVNRAAQCREETKYADPISPIWTRSNG